MNLFDKTMDAFSASDLKKRVWWVVLMGIVLISVTIFFGTGFLKKNFSTSVEGAASISDEDPLVLKIEMPENEFARFESFKGHALKLVVEAKKETTEDVSILNVDPVNKSVTLKISNAITDAPAGKMAARIILVDRPYWRLLWDDKEQ